MDKDTTVPTPAATSAAAFVREFNACFAKAKQGQVPLSVIIATLEVAKSELISSFLTARTINNFHALAKAGAVQPPIDGQHKHD